MKPELADPRKVFGAAVLDAARTNADIVVLSADSGGSSGFGKFRDEFPDRYLEFGIMEQGVVGFASGIAAVGALPVFCAIAPFVTSRPYEMFRNDVGYMRQNVKIVGRNGGISYSDLGATHHSLEDFAIIRMIPDIVILSPADPDEIREATLAMLAHRGPVYMRIGNAPLPRLFDPAPFVIGRGRVARAGTDITLIATGPLTGNAMAAAELLANQGIDAELIAIPTLRPLDTELILTSGRKTGKIVTIEEHYVVGGLGTMVQEIVAETWPIPVKKLGIPHTFATSGSYEEVLAYYGLSAEGIADAVAAFAAKTPVLA